MHDADILAWVLHVWPADEQARFDAEYTRLLDVHNPAQRIYYPGAYADAVRAVVLAQHETDKANNTADIEHYYPVTYNITIEVQS